MIKTINMQVMRYINLFAKISKIPPKHCFLYNNTIIFVVPENKVSLAIGENGSNIKKISKTLHFNFIFEILNFHLTFSQSVIHKITGFVKHC